MARANRNNFSTQARHLTLAVLVLLLQACTFMQRSVFSAPVLGHEQRLAETNGILMQLEGFDLAVSIENRWITREIIGIYPLPPFIPTWSTPDYKPPMRVQVRFDTGDVAEQSADEKAVNEPAPDGLSFNPMKVSIESHDMSWSPTGFYGPGGRLVFPGPSPSARQRYPCAPDGDVRTTNTAVNVSGQACFWLIFDRSPSPEEPFTLHLGGVKRAGRTVMIPVFLFKKGQAWYGGTIP
jgi:hypothetical protein